MTTFSDLALLQDYFGRGSNPSGLATLYHSVSGAQERRQRLDDLARKFARDDKIRKEERSNQVDDLADARKADTWRALSNLALQYGIPVVNRDGSARDAAKIYDDLNKAQHSEVESVVRDYDSQIDDNRTRVKELGDRIRETVTETASPEIEKQAIAAAINDASIAKILSPVQREGLLSGKKKPNDVYQDLASDYVFRSGKASENAALFMQQYLQEVNARLGEKKKIDLALLSGEVKDLDRERLSLMSKRSDYIRSKRHIIGDSIPISKPPTSQGSTSEVSSKYQPNATPKLDQNGIVPDLKERMSGATVVPRPAAIAPIDSLAPRGALDYVMDLGSLAGSRVDQFQRSRFGDHLISDIASAGIGALTSRNPLAPTPESEQRRADERREQEVYNEDQAAKSPIVRQFAFGFNPIGLPRFEYSPSEAARPITPDQVSRAKGLIEMRQSRANPVHPIDELAAPNRTGERMVSIFGTSDLGLIAQAEKLLLNKGMSRAEIDALGHAAVNNDGAAIQTLRDAVARVRIQPKFYFENRTRLGY